MPLRHRGDGTAAEAKHPARASTSSSVTLSIVSRSATAMCSAGVCTCDHPVGEIHAREAARVEHVRVRAAADVDRPRLEPRALDGLGREREDRVVRLEAVAGVRLGDSRFDLALRDRSGKRKRVEHLLDEIRELTLVTGARLGASSQRSGTTFRRRAASIRPTLAVVSSSIRPSLQVGDRARGRDDGRAALLRCDAPRARSDPGTRRRRSSPTARRTDNPAHRRRCSRRRSRAWTARRVWSKSLAPWRPTSSLTVKRSSTPACGRPSERSRRARLEEHRHGRLVVGAEDGVRPVANEPVLADDRLDLAYRRNRVHVRAQEDRAAAVLLGRLEPGEQVPRLLVLVDREPEVGEVRADDRRDRFLLPDGLGMAASSTKRSRTLEAQVAPMGRF